MTLIIIPQTIRRSYSASYQRLDTSYKDSLAAFFVGVMELMMLAKNLTTNGKHDALHDKAV